jgi:hypothetical protein
MKPRDVLLAHTLDDALQHHSANVRNLSGVRSTQRRLVLVEQLLDSLHRVEYARRLSSATVSPRRADPNDVLFDPLKAAVLRHQLGDVDEAFWLVFLFVHFGKHKGLDWRYLSAVYGRLGGVKPWDWQNVSASPKGFRRWLGSHESAIKSVHGGFGNHRKYISLSAWSNAGTGAAFETYVDWVGPSRSHSAVVNGAIQAAGHNPKEGFDLLYRSMNAVASFGRMARFDYLTMLGKLGFANIEPPRPYLSGATGPLAGARLLYGVEGAASQMDHWLVELDADLNVGMQVVEDAICNWQKRPDVYVRFRG